MKKYTCFLIVFFITNLNLVAQDNKVISTMRIGIFKLKMTVPELEKAMGQKIQVRHKQEALFDTAKIMYNQAYYILSFSKRYIENSNTGEVLELYAVSTSTTTLKTKSGIGIGNTKAEILSTYDKYDITITNDYEYKEKGNVKDKIQFIRLHDYDAATTLVFKTEDRIVKAIEVMEYIGE